MPLTDHARLLREQVSARVVEVWKALAPLQSVVSFMNTGAHPDDETSAMLAALGFRDGLDLSYCCSTRGEGGQNDIGTESGAALGTLRTAEMERACDVLNMRMYWLSPNPTDPVTDFGFSKSGVETLKAWGRDRTLQRFVHAIRAERPDIICPTFLDIPGQHGHHRAMTEAAHLVMDLAADPAFDAGGLPPWQVKKLYLPAWSGAGQAYDDDLPPPPATLLVQADGTDPVSGFSYEQIGQFSRAFHRTQAMGRWVALGAERNWPLHLADSRVSGPDTDITAGLPQTLRDLGLAAAQDHLDAARAAFPDFERVVIEASAALAILQGAQVASEDAHRVRRKITQISRLIRIASGVRVEASVGRDALRPGQETAVHLAISAGIADDASGQVLVSQGWQTDGQMLCNVSASPSDPYPDVYLPDAPNAPCVEVSVTSGGVQSISRVAFEVPPLALPAIEAAVLSGSDVINLASKERSVHVVLGENDPSDGPVALQVPSEWSLTRTDTGFSVTAPDDVAAGRYVLPLSIGGTQAQQAQRIAFDHIDPRVLTSPAEVKIQVIDAKLPMGNFGYIGAGHDRVDHWMNRMGLETTALGDDQFSTDAVLSAFDTIVIGIFAFKFRSALAGNIDRLHRWVENGGTLVTLYHRPWDNWSPDATPPKYLEIGQPSLRWRVTDQTAHVTHLHDHPALTSPNRIGPEDWSNWHKERGLYFAKSWDAAYVPLLEMADPDENPHQGALLAADIGAGRHVHCALILHHQMEHLVPGAFRLLANFVAPRR